MIILPYLLYNFDIVVLFNHLTFTFIKVYNVNMKVNQNISANALHGEKVQLTEQWKDKNVICPNTKLFYIIEGEIIIEMEKEVICAVEGDMVLIPAGTKHNYHLSSLGRAKKYWLHIDLLVDGKNFFNYYYLPYKIHVGKNDYLEGLFINVLKSLTSTNLYENLFCSSQLLSILSFYSERGEYLEKSVTYDEIDNTISYIKDNYTNTFSLLDLAKIAKLSPSYFVRKFKNRTGYSPMAYVNLLKIDKAKTMIEQSNEPINSILEKLGFFDSAHFSKLFKNSTGYSPSQFRKVNGYRSANKTI